jgi:Flp pilus assembly protein protease CpaA
MPSPFFPHLALGWAFVVTLLAIMAAASSTDLRRMKVPKVLTLSALGCGVLFNLIRGAWLGTQGLNVWYLHGETGLLGAFDGLLFTVAGFLTGFGLFFLLWILGVCGGGDVKLFAALGAWLGPMMALEVLIATLPLIFLIALVRMLGMLLSGRAMRPGTMFKASRSRRRPDRPYTDWRIHGYSLPLALAALAVMLWSFRVDLHVVPTREAQTAKAGSHGN